MTATETEKEIIISTFSSEIARIMREEGEAGKTEFSVADFFRIVDEAKERTRKRLKEIGYDD
jgi:hypothetical protein